MRTGFLLATAIGALALATCGTKQPPRAERAALRQEVDGTADFAAAPDALRGAVVAGLRAQGHDVALDDAATQTVTTAPRVEPVARWRWNQAVAPASTAVAGAAAALATGGVAFDPPQRRASDDVASDQGGIDDVTVEISWQATLVMLDDRTTRVVLQPRAIVDGSDVTDRYIADVLGPEEARRRWNAMFDAIREALGAPVPPGTVPAG